MKYLFSTLPYIVATRNANTMPKNLLGDSFPVLFEGLHTTGLLTRCKQAGKKVLVRMHNLEHRYYRSLSSMENRPFHKLFFQLEANKLRRYESILDHADHLLGISKQETVYLEQTYGHAVFIPAFHRYEEISVLPGTGSYILFHGNLGVAENHNILRRFALPALTRVAHQVVVAGKNPSGSLIRRLERYPHIRLVANPSDQEMEQLIRNAQVNLVLTGQSTGIKLKLLHALFSGRHCLANPPMVAGSGLEELCTVVSGKKELVEQIERLMQFPVPQEELLHRKKALMEYTNRAGAEKILRLIS